MPPFSRPTDKRSPCGGAPTIGWASRTRSPSCVCSALHEDQSDLANWTRGDRRARFEQTAERHAGLSQVRRAVSEQDEVRRRAGRGHLADPSGVAGLPQTPRGGTPRRPDFAPPVLQLAPDIAYRRLKYVSDWRLVEGEPARRARRHRPWHLPPRRRRPLIGGYLRRAGVERIDDAVPIAPGAEAVPLRRVRRPGVAGQRRGCRRGDAGAGDVVERGQPGRRRPAGRVPPWTFGSDLHGPFEPIPRGGLDWGRTHGHSRHPRYRPHPDRRRRRPEARRRHHGRRARGSRPRRPRPGIFSGSGSLLDQWSMPAVGSDRRQRVPSRTARYFFALSRSCTVIRAQKLVTGVPCLCNTSVRRFLLD